MLKQMLCLALGLLLFHSCTDKAADISVFQTASSNGSLVNEGYNRCISYVNEWMNHSDSLTGLIPRNINESRDYWNAWDAAADNYPFMVLTSSITMPEFFRTRASEMLLTEERLTSRIGKLPDTYSFSKRGFRNEIADTSQIIFGSAEYMKDGLIPLTEWLGESPWSKRMLGILDDLNGLTRVVEELPGSFYGGSAVAEVNGDLLQVLSRMYWFTGKREYLEWASQIADHYLNETNLPTNVNGKLRIRDHGCEIISGLCEAYLAASWSWPEKRDEWKPYIHSMLDRILEIGRNPDGLFYNEINPVTGEIISDGIADTFGYTLNAYYFVYQLDSVAAYREAVLKGLEALNRNYAGYDWERGSADGYTDAIEGALNLYNREQLTSVKEWIDSQIKVMWDMQKPSGMIEGWHGDGNFARTTIMYCLWKSQGLTAEDWHEDLKLGAECKDGVLYASISCDPGWSGKIKFDLPRWRDKMNMPVDYPRINQFQQWFTVEAWKNYEVRFHPSGKKKDFSGMELINGLQVSIKPGEDLFMTVKKYNGNHKMHDKIHSEQN
jgi:hypothetical protein